MTDLYHKPDCTYILASGRGCTCGLKPYRAPAGLFPGMNEQQTFQELKRRENARRERTPGQMTDADKAQAYDLQIETWEYLWRWVERGLFDKTTDANEAMSVMLHHPGAPWATGEWDVTHKPYAKRFYEKFPKAKPKQ